MSTRTTALASSWKRIRECVFCPKGENLNSLSICETSYKCFRCNRSGPMQEYLDAKARYRTNPPSTRALPNTSSSFTSSFSNVSTTPLLKSLCKINALVESQIAASATTMTSQVILISSSKTGLGKTTLLNQLLLDAAAASIMQNHDATRMLLHCSLEQPLVRSMQVLAESKSSTLGRGTRYDKFEKLPLLFTPPPEDFASMIRDVRFAHEYLQVHRVFIDALNRFPGTLEANLHAWKQEFANTPVDLVATVHPTSKSLAASGDLVAMEPPILLRDSFLADVRLLIKESGEDGAKLLEVINSKGQACGQVPITFRNHMFAEE